MKEQFFSKRNIVCVVMLLLVYILSTWFYNASGDISVIIKYAKMVPQAIADGGLFNYYEYALDNIVEGTVPNYNYFIYLFFTICLAPVYLLNAISPTPAGAVGEILIVNTFLLIFVILSGVLCYKLSRLIGLNKQKSFEVFFIEQTSIILIFGSIGFCQFDVVYLDIILCALLFWYKKQYHRFSLLMSVAIMLKFLPVIIFIPLVLVTHKKLGGIIKHLLIGASCPVVYALLVRIDAGYSKAAEYSNNSLDFALRIFPDDVRLSWGYISLFVIAFVLICYFAYDSEMTDENRLNRMIVPPILSYGSFIITTAWHPQWLVVIAPFMSLAIVLDVGRRSLVWADAIFGIAAVLMLNVGLGGQVDNYMVNNGIIGHFTEYSGITMSDAIQFDYMQEALLSIVIASMLCSMVNVWRDMKTDISIEEVNSREYDFNYSVGILIRGAFLILYPIGLIVFNCVMN